MRWTGKNWKGNVSGQASCGLFTSVIKESITESYKYSTEFFTFLILLERFCCVIITVGGHPSLASPIFLFCSSGDMSSVF